MFYFAYGSNLNKEQMSYRCPKAKPIGAMILPDCRLIFRGVADIEHHAGGNVYGGLWKITRECERALDRYEGVRGGLYRKEYLEVEVTRKGKAEAGRALVYVMNSNRLAMPSRLYLGTIRKGFHDFGLDTAHLNAAVEWTREEIGPAIDPWADWEADGGPDGCRRQGRAAGLL